MGRMWIKDIHWSEALRKIGEYNNSSLIENIRSEGSKYILGSSKSGIAGFFGIYLFSPTKQPDGIFWEPDFKLNI